MVCAFPLESPDGAAARLLEKLSDPLGNDGAYLFRLEMI
jgi:hypothetical protein